MKRWLRDRLEESFTPQEIPLLYGSYDVVGDIAVIRVPSSLEQKSHHIGKAIMGKNQYIRTVLRQASPVSGKLRRRRLQWVSGEKKPRPFTKNGTVNSKLT